MKKRFNTDSMTFLLPAESAATPAAVDYGNYYLVPLRQQASQTPPIPAGNRTPHLPEKKSTSA
jgi:hypothetical protein